MRSRSKACGLGKEKSEYSFTFRYLYPVSALPKFSRRMMLLKFII